MPDLDPMELRALRAEVALEKGLPAKHAARLVGGSREELLADADQLRTDLGLGGQQQGAAPSFDGGQQGDRIPASAGGPGAAGHAEALRRFGAASLASGVDTSGRPAPSSAIPTGNF